MRVKYKLRPATNKDIAEVMCVLLTVTGGVVSMLSHNLLELVGGLVWIVASGILLFIVGRVWE